MRNASRMARYMMLNSMRQGGNSRGEMRGEGGNMRNEMRNEGARYEMRGEMRNEGREEMRGEYGRSEMRNGYGGEMRNEGGNYARDNYGVDNRFRDRRGREHYDNGRFAPMRNAYGDMGGGDYGADSRGERAGGNYGAENRGGREGEMRRGGGRSEMRGGWDDEEEGGRMNMIGFDRPQEAQNHYPTRIDYMPRNEMERGSSPKMTGGAMGMGMEFTPEIAKEWTKKLHNEDGTKGEHWSMEQVKKQMTQRGVEYNAAEVYAIMNVLYSDYCKVFKKYGFNSAEAYLDLAIAWLNDADAVENKAMMYYECIVKH